MILLDTHVLIWLTEGLRDLGPKARAAADEALVAGELAVSAITFWEIAMLEQKGRIRIIQPLSSYRREILDKGLSEIPLSGELGIQAARLAQFHSNPADRIITATATTFRATLLTADSRILDWQSPLRRMDARS